MPNKKTARNKKLHTAVSKLDTYFAAFELAVPTPILRFTECLCVFAFLFGLLGISWLIPVPKDLNFGGYFNWASLVMAALIYYWYTLSPSLAYGMILLIALLSYLVVLVNMKLATLPYGWALYMLIVLLYGGLSLLFFRPQLGVQNAKEPPIRPLIFPVLGPLWFLHFLYKRLKITY